MIKKILFLCWACVTASVSYAQSPEGYHPIAKEGKVWNYQMDFQKDGNTCQYHYVVRGDTVINDVTYKKVLFERSDFSMYVAAIRDDSHKTFIIPYGEDSEILFSALDLDSEGYVYDSIADLQYRYKSTGSVNTDGIPLRKINFTFSPKYGPFPISYNEGYWIEGIGSGVNMDPFLPMSLSYTRVFEKLISCYHDGERIYHSDEDAVSLANIPLPLEQKYKVGHDTSISPDSIWLEYSENNVVTIYIVGAKSNFRCKVDDDLGIEKPWTEIPLHNGSCCYFIGRLMKGQNTITIENEYESYTATFLYPFDLYTSVTSPSDKSVNCKSENSKWSALSGRRFPSLPTQKGIYIKDGRKVLIK